jgi:hypothetical protein
MNKGYCGNWINIISIDRKKRDLKIFEREQAGVKGERRRKGKEKRER